MGDKKININWYPGHMAKTKREIKEKLELIDVVFEVIDARIPYSSKNKDIEEMIKNKPRILLMTKLDLCDKEVSNKWKIYYEGLGYKVIMLDLLNNIKLNSIYEETDKLLLTFLVPLANIPITPSVGLKTLIILLLSL